VKYEYSAFGEIFTKHARSMISAQTVSVAPVIGGIPGITSTTWVARAVYCRCVELSTPLARYEELGILKQVVEYAVVEVRPYPACYAAPGAGQQSVKDRITGLYL